MVRRKLWLLPLLAAAGCARPAPPPATMLAPRRPAVPATPASLPDRVRQDPWLTRFWAQLTPGQRRRVLGRLQRRDPATTPESAAQTWDALGLPERDTLIFGAPRLPATPA